MDNEQNAVPRTQDTDIDHHYWGRMPGWTLSEAAALFLGIDPDCLNHEAIKDAKAGTPEWEYFKLHRRLCRARKMDQLSSLTPPREFLEWAVSNGLSPSDQLTGSVIVGPKTKNWKKKYFAMKRKKEALEEANVHPNERSTFLKMILGMAHDKYRYKPGTKHHTVELICGVLDRCGLSVGDDAVRTKAEGAPERFGLPDENP